MQLSGYDMTAGDIDQLVQRFRAVEADVQAADELEAHLIAAGIDPDVAERAVDKSFRLGPLCMAKTRKGTPCIALGDCCGGRCRNHGGMSTGPTSDKGRKRALAALARYRERSEG